MRSPIWSKGAKKTAGARRGRQGLWRPLGALLLFFIFQHATQAVGALVPRALLKWSGNRSEYAILVDKEAQEIWVFHKRDSTRPLAVFPCSTGENGGPKRRKNDRRTPEGVYFFTRSFTKKDLSSTYGVRAFPIDYPNALDRLKGRGGYGIWFHGTNKALKPRDTNGCIVLENGDIERLARYVRLKETPVIIAGRIEWVEERERKAEAQAVQEALERWRNAWQQGDLTNYIASYGGDFRSRGMDLAGWKRHKAGLFRRYKEIRVEMEGLELFVVNGVVLARFHQEYRGDGFSSSGEKRLYLAQNSKAWKIVGEFFEEKARVVTTPKPVDRGKGIARFVRAWKDAWASKDIEAYMACYDETFRSRGMDREGWRRFKAALNRKYGALRITLEELKIRALKGGRAHVRFRQRYATDTYHDDGWKDLWLVKRGNQWKIWRETWKRIPEKGTASPRGVSPTGPP